MQTTPAQPRPLVYALQQNIRRVIVGKDEAIELLLISLICRGHVLIEDVPGVGKTTMAAALAKSLQCSFKRIQFTPDVTPSDVTGFTLVNIQTGEMEFKPGAVMSQIVLADEINRTSPKTQSSLLEVMEEGQVTVDGVTHLLPKPFMVLATQNPVDFVGTYPLPEAQMDRFFMRIAIGYPTVEEEIDVLERYSGQAHADARARMRSGGNHRHAGAGGHDIRQPRGAQLYRQHRSHDARARRAAAWRIPPRRDCAFAGCAGLRAAVRARLRAARRYSPHGAARAFPPPDSYARGAHEGRIGTAGAVPAD